MTKTVNNLECLLIEQSKIRVQHYIKQTPKQWLLRIYEDAEEKITLGSIGCEILLMDVYAQIKFENVEEE